MFAHTTGDDGIRRAAMFSSTTMYMGNVKVPLSLTAYRFSPLQILK
jgi:hypothetical protein